MRKTTKSTLDSPLTVDIDRLMSMLCCGKATARKIGEASGAKIHVGSRVIYHVGRVEEYLNSLTED
ncbi:MAG: hypothetical protein LUG99_15785 [Lachnospiraceae bacterium]|nr:hypothetical protein [Lachnospiraceae bacterium]